MSHVQSFVRILPDAAAPESFETAVVHYAAPDSESELSVDFISAVHIGDAAYYQELNRRFAGYDALLYELVRPEEELQAVKPDRGLLGDVFSKVQLALPVLLGFEHQLQQIDYSKLNFVHADLSPEKLGAEMTSMGATPISLLLEVLLKAVAQAQRNQQGPPQVDPQALASAGSVLLNLPDNLSELRLQIKRQMAASLAGDALGLISGTSVYRLLIEARNAAALEVLRHELSLGHKRVGVFYGAGHGSDFEARLKSELGLERTNTEWLQAWDLS